MSGRAKANGRLKADTAALARAVLEAESKREAALAEHKAANQVLAGSTFVNGIIRRARNAAARVQFHEGRIEHHTKALAEKREEVARLEAERIPADKRLTDAVAVLADADAELVKAREAFEAADADRVADADAIARARELGATDEVDPVKLSPLAKREIPGGPGPRYINPDTGKVRRAEAAP